MLVSAMKQMKWGKEMESDRVLLNTDSSGKLSANQEVTPVKNLAPILK